jgi:5-methylcytosine-specific restriction endonuclease McrA
MWICTSIPASAPMTRPIKGIFHLERFLFSGLRRLSRFYPPKNEALKLARIRPAIYQCNRCKKGFKREEVKVDHILPVIDPTVGFCDWNTYIKRLFCAAKELQVLCDGCHDLKTAAENEIRRKRVKETKKNA